ncbi:MAG: hypothetical protein P857_796 [Candidatus Xenolissoclinum pacificiensis L6]|uniref:Transposase n=1 Tax=Candidatus Xenolissoclinum pacificiensis L6 TaxID=1401685 RepID=W2UZN5_9RICK|nr:MAG: hypothetical protein P857_796 [Candidatus Xenolissoclinum pacificiensis L6]
MVIDDNCWNKLKALISAGRRENNVFLEGVCYILRAPWRNLPKQYGEAI